MTAALVDAVTAALAEAVKEADGDKVDLIFKCYQHGRLIATTYPPLSSTPAIWVPATASTPGYHIIQFAGYYRQRFGQPLEHGLDYE